MWLMGPASLSLKQRSCEGGWPSRVPVTHGLAEAEEECGSLGFHSSDTWCSVLCFLVTVAQESLLLPSMEGVAFLIDKWRKQLLHSAWVCSV